jgi:hypothetical protein
VAGPLRDPGPRAQRALGDLAGDVTPGTGEAIDPHAADPAGDVGASAPDAAASGSEEPVEPLPDAPVGGVEEWSLDQLHRRASEVGLEGRWDMTRDELVAALREP